VSTAAAIQRRYYERTAHVYDTMHAFEDDAHYLAMKYISGFIDMLAISSVLDVGCGTGRGILHLSQTKPSLRVHGIEPIRALIQQAVNVNAVPHTSITCSSGDALPFADRSFEATYECGVLHHAKNPSAVVKEMMRVSTKAIFLSDENRFAHGSTLARWGKLFLCKTGLFRTAYRVKTFGKGYRLSENDGLAYSYSVFDCTEALSQWADRIILIPLDNDKPKSIFQPLLTCFHILLCAVRDETNLAQQPRSGIASLRKSGGSK
jgi:ubiquinone/menaquinone biosynthesis C-methylase UbiE